ncbi:hypothetical protein QBC44DRAFT_389917 [Cladorrhinum sp. PSN332]|nr:hypothetical protein QBC44DRAFT_389917 [Cladorrhinum sp. PSN332]
MTMDSMFEGQVFTVGDLYRDASNNDAYPYCNPATESQCILNGLYLFPTLEFSNENSQGNAEFLARLPDSTFTITPWTNNKIPQTCVRWSVTQYGFSINDFSVFNVTYPDCSVPFVVCYHRKAQKTISQIATEIGRMPIKIRQSTAAYLVFSNNDSDNPPAYNIFIGALSDSGLILGKSSGYFPSALVHELTHNMDGSILSPTKPNPWGTGSSFSSSFAWINASTTDGYAIAAYGTRNHGENFAEAGRALLLDAVYPGGLANFTGNNPNLTQIDNQMSAIKSVASAYYTTGGSCDLSKKFPFPTSLVDVPTPTTTTPPTVTATPWGQCGGVSHTGATACGYGYACSSINPYYSQCAPTPIP